MYTDDKTKHMQASQMFSSQTTTFRSEHQHPAGYRKKENLHYDYFFYLIHEQLLKNTSERGTKQTSG